MCKEVLLEVLAKEDEQLLAMAYLYAKNITTYGVDISKRWTTIIEQNANLEQAYKKGYYDAMKEKHS